MGKSISKIPINKLYVGLKVFDNHFNIGCEILLISKEKYTNADVIIYKYNDGKITYSYHRFNGFHLFNETRFTLQNK